MIKLVGVILFMVLLIILIINTRETFSNQVDPDLFKDAYKDILKEYSVDSTGNKCAPLENLKKQKENNNFKRLPCSSANTLIGVSDKCRKDYCNEMPNCQVKDNVCLSDCELISHSNDSEEDKKEKCLNNNLCQYDDKESDLKKRCAVSPLTIYAANSNKIDETCGMINTSCKNDEDCIDNLCEVNRFCEVKDKKCVMRRNINTINSPANSSSDSINGYSSSTFGAPLMAINSNISNIMNNVDNKVDNKLNNVDNKLDNKLNNVENKLNNVDNKVDNILNNVDDRLDNVRDKIQDKLSNINTNLVTRDYDILENRKYNEMNNFNSDFEYNDIKKFFNKNNDNKNNKTNDNIEDYDFDLSNNSNQNVIVRRHGERQGIVQQHIDGVGNIYAPEIIIH